MANEQKTVCLTGCTKGLGAAMVTEFVAKGWRVVGCGRDEPTLAALRQKFGSPHLFLCCDVANESQIAAFAQEVLVSGPAPDLLLNNAAMINPNRPLWEMSAEDIDRIVNTNIKGPMHMMRHFLPAMLQQGRGVVVNFSSGWGRSTSPEVAPYCASKWAMEGLSQAVAQETNSKVAVVALNPGIIDTDMLRSCFGSGASQFPGAIAWAKTAVPFLIKLSAKDNGRALTAP